MLLRVEMKVDKEEGEGEGEGEGECEVSTGAKYLGAALLFGSG